MTSRTSDTFVMGSLFLFGYNKNILIYFNYMIKNHKMSNILDLMNIHNNKAFGIFQFDLNLHFVSVTLSANVSGLEIRN